MPVTRSSKKKTIGKMLFASEPADDIYAESSVAAAQSSCTARQYKIEEDLLNVAPGLLRDPPQSQEPAQAVPPNTSQTTPAPPPRSMKTTSSQKAIRLAKAREEMLQIELKLAQARIAAIEAEESEDEDAEFELHRCPQHRVDEWLESNRKHMETTVVIHTEESAPAHPQHNLPAQTGVAQLFAAAPLFMPVAPPTTAAAVPPLVGDAQQFALAAAPPYMPRAPSNTAAAVPPRIEDAQHFAPAAAPLFMPGAPSNTAAAVPPRVENSQQFALAAAPKFMPHAPSNTAAAVPPQVEDAKQFAYAAAPTLMPVAPPTTAAAAAAVQPLVANTQLAATAPPFIPAQNNEERNKATYYTQPRATESNHRSVDISELASAIAIAARAGHSYTSRYNIELPLFNGAFQDWLSFRAAYTESASSYNDTDNVARLRRSLKGRAKEAVENLLIHNARPEDIIKTLEARFGRPDSIAFAELERLRALPRLTDSPRDICVFASRVANSMAALKALNRAHYLFSPETTKTVLEKLTPTLRYRWFDYAAVQRTEEPDLSKLATFLQREADYCAPYALPESVERPELPVKKIHKTFVATDKPVQKCVCCNTTGHYIDKCPKYAKEEVDERWKIAKDKRLCFRCLRYRSRTHHCKRIKCERDGCEYFHHKLLHYKKLEEENANEVVKEAVASTWSSKATRAYLKVAPIEISGPAGVAHTYALLDDGSTITLVHEDIARQVGLDGPIVPLQIEAITNEKINASRSRRVTLNVRGATKNEHKIYARTIDDLRLSPQSIRNEDLHTCEHLHDIEGHLKYTSAVPTVLIGQDNWHLLVSSETRRGQRHQPIASLTALGWVLHGAHTRSLGKQIHTTNHLSAISQEDDNMNKQLADYFALESLFIEPKRPQSDVEEKALVMLSNKMTTTDDGHYQTPLLWKNEDVQLPDNYDNTLKRLHNIERKLDKDEELKKRYNIEMEALLSKGYAEPAPLNKEKKVWYLPHFAVLNPLKPNKVRIVHDAAAKTKGESLNDHLLTGPDLLQSLPGVLMRFRQHPIAVGADIREMFMQVKIKPEDRDALRYLWRGDSRGDAPPREYRMTSLIFGATCSPAIAIYVKNTNAQKYKDTRPNAARAIVRNHYVDDYLQSFETEAEAIKIAGDVRYIHKQAHYELRQWTSNSTRVLESLQDSPADPTHFELNKYEMKNERVLGQIWKPTTDELAFNLDLTRLPPGVLDDEAPTKRQVLRIMMSVYDPLGLASPVTIQAKKILQEIWRRGTGWDDKLDKDLAQQWVEWTRHLKALRDVAIPRHYPSYTEASSRQLHTFVDASETAYTCALYWRVTTNDGTTHVSLITAKAKVAPLKLTSIPRLELQAAVLGSKIASAVIEEHDLKPEEKIFWTDSKTVLAWLRAGARSYRPFVAHRITAIEENSTISEWRWVPTKLNVADEATRDVPRDFDARHIWFTGPEFLYEDPSKWPTEPERRHIESTAEERVHSAREKTDTNNFSWLPSPQRYSKWEQLTRTIGRVLQFLDLCRPHREKTHYKRTRKNKQQDPDWSNRRKPDAPKQTPRKQHYVDKYSVLDAAYIIQAERLVIRASQHESFGDELNALQNNKPPSKHSRLRSLAIELIDGVITLKTRIDAVTNITEQQKRPPIVDGNHIAAKLYIDYIHRRMNHQGVEATINECKQYYCIVRLRPVARMVLHRCLPCRIQKSKPPVPPTGNHPTARLAHHRRPFTYTGVDYFGPVTVTVGRGTQKRYVALFTCLTVRAVHLEVVPSLSGDSALMALRRMVARRGCPAEIWSDNATNFHAADRELRDVFTKATQQEASQRLITWRFIPAGAPFMGGAWERLVSNIKRALYAVLKERNPSDETLVTLLAEAEYTVNSRPLTHVPVDPNEPEAITPNHFLLGGSAREPTSGTFDDSTLIGRATWRTSQRLADHFWGRWMREYLPTLQYRREPYGRGPPVAVDDVVLIADGTLPRNTWPRGRVIATYPGPDGVTRVVDVQTKGGVFRRPAKKLIILPTKPADLQTPGMPHSPE